MGAEFKIEGMGGLLDTIESMAAAPGKVEDAALKAAGQIILKESQRNLEKESTHHKGKKYFQKNSINSGDLRDSGKVTNVKVDKGGSKYVKVQYDNKGLLVEDGHGGPAPAPAHPFLRPAFKAKKEEAAAILTEELKGAMK
jgi:HK97 gp10 family phage protein